MNENDISEETYSNIIKRMIYTMTYSSIDDSKTKIVLDWVKALAINVQNTYDKLNKNGVPFDYSMNKGGDMTNVYGNILSMSIGYASKEKIYIKTNIYSRKY